MAAQVISPNDVKQDNLQAYLKQEGFDHWKKVQDMTYYRIVRASESQLDDALKERGIKDGLSRSDYVAAITQLPKWKENHPYQSGLFLSFSFEKMVSFFVIFVLFCVVLFFFAVSIIYCARIGVSYFLFCFVLFLLFLSNIGSYWIYVIGYI